MNDKKEHGADQHGSPVPVEKRFKHWIYALATRDSIATASDGTQYRILRPSGSFVRITRKPHSQRSRRRAYGKMRRESGLTRSQFDRSNAQEAEA